jgi:hypothetical protein
MKDRRGGMRGGVAAGLSMLMPIAASAQVDAPFGRTFEAPARSITLSVSNELFYDTNLARGSDELATLRRVEKEDFRSTTTASVDLTLPSGRSLFTLEGTLGYDAYARNERLDRERIDVQGTAVVPLAFCSVDVRAGYTRRQNDLADLSLELAAPARSSVNVQTIKRGAATLTCGPAIGFRPFASVGVADTSNSGSLRRGQDVEQIDYRVGISYANPLVGVVSLVARRSEFDYDARRIGVLVVPASFRLSYGGLQIDRRLGARLQMTGSLGYADVKLPAGFGSGHDLDGLNWDLAATLRGGDRVLLSFRTERAIEASSGIPANFVRKTSVGATITYALSPTLTADASATRWRREFQVDQIRQPLLITEDEGEEFGVGLAYKRHRLRFRLNGSYRRRDADPDIYDFDAFLVSLGVTYLFNP